MTNFILGTDWWTDCDDVAALRILTRMHKAKKINLLGVGINACMEYSAASLNAFLISEGLGDIPVGLDKEATDFYANRLIYQGNMAKNPHTVTNDDCIDAVKLYRKLLAGANGSVDIAEIGFSQVLAGLLESEADEFSPLNGMELVQQKVKKLWMMAGNWERERGNEHNFANNYRSRRAGEKVCRLWPTEITFLGWEVGNTVISGGNINNDILGRAFEDLGFACGRSSWDPMLCLMACIQDENEAGYSVVKGTASVDGETGDNFFVKSECGRHRYVVKKHEDEYYSEQINAILFGE